MGSFGVSVTNPFLGITGLRLPAYARRGREDNLTRGQPAPGFLRVRRDTFSRHRVRWHAYVLACTDSVAERSALNQHFVVVAVAEILIRLEASFGGNNTADLGNLVFGAEHDLVAACFPGAVFQVDPVPVHDRLGHLDHTATHLDEFALECLPVREHLSDGVTTFRFFDRLVADRDFGNRSS